MKKGTKEYRLFSAALIGFICALITYAVCAAAFSPIAYMLASPSRYLGIFSMLSLCISGISTGLFVARVRSSLRAACALISSVMTGVLLIGISALIEGSISGAALINWMIFTLCALVFSSLSKGEGRRKMKRIRY